MFPSFWEEAMTNLFSEITKPTSHLYEVARWFCWVFIPYYNVIPSELNPNLSIEKLLRGENSSISSISSNLFVKMGVTISSS
jgi:hypothetical protein